MFEVDDIERELALFLKNEGQINQRNVSSFVALLARSSKSGLSAREVAKNIITRQAEAGAPVGNLADGSESISEKMEYIRAEEIIKHFIQNAKILVTIPAGTPIQGQGIGADGIPVAVTGIVSGIATGTAIIL